MRKGFTLLEVLVAVAIVMILVGASFVYYRNADKKGIQSQLITIATAMQEYEKDNGGTYPISNFSSFLQDTTRFPVPLDPSDYSVSETTSTVTITYVRNASVQYAFTKSQMGVNP